MILRIEKGEKSYGGSTVFSDMDFSVNEGEKVALIGRNGAGKTTLLRIIAEAEILDSGKFTKYGKPEIGYLSQVAVVNEQLTVREFLMTVFQDILDIQKRITEIEKELARDHETVNLKAYEQLVTRFQQSGGYNLDFKVANIFTRFGFGEADLTRQLSTFSGGQKTKIAFARLLLQEPTLLLLDEPTNHLDLETIEWLETYLKEYPKALVIVSHDRYFIDRVCGVTYEIELGRTSRYGGNYSFFQETKKLLLIQESKAYKNQQEEIERLEKQIEKFRYKKDKAAFAQSKIKYLERMEKIEPTKLATKTFNADFKVSARGGKTVCVLEKYTIGYDRPLAKLSLNIQRGQKIGVIGPNGCGKSTLLKSIANKVPALAGEKNFGHQIKISYFDQSLTIVNQDNTVLDELWGEYQRFTKTEIRSHLGDFLFSGDDVFKKIQVLSEGEKVRLSFAKLLLEESNFLLLDEPTNHLDILSKEVLETALQAYTGTILFVSHDRYFIDKLADSLLVYEGDNFEYFPLTYQEYQRREKTQKDPPIIKPSKTEQPINVQKTLEKLEKRITKAETVLEELRNLLFEEEYYTDFIKAQALQERIDAADDELASLVRQWEELQ